MPDAANFVPDSIDPSAVAEADLRNSAGGPYGLTEEGFIPKPYARLVAEGLARAQLYFGDDIDVRPGSVLRRLIEMSALEHARTHATLAAMYDSLFVSSASGDALSRLGEELGLPRPAMQASGTISITLVAPLPAGGFVIPAGARMLSPGGHHAALAESARFADNRKTVTVAVQAFYPGAEHNLDPAVATEKLALWNPVDPALDGLRRLAADSGMTAEAAAPIAHTAPLTGGDSFWTDGRYRELLLQAPRSIWSVEALRTAVSLVPGVAAVQVIDEFGGLDLDRSIFGNFNFVQGLFSAARDYGSPYAFRVMVKPSAAAIWDGADGLHATIAEAIEDLRPMGVFADIRKAEEIGVAVNAKLVVKGEPLPAGDRASVNASPAAMALKGRLLDRIRSYVGGLTFGEPVRAAHISWAMLNEPGIEDVLDLRLARVLPNTPKMQFSPEVTDAAALTATMLPEGDNLTLARDQVAVLIDDPSGLEIL
ncbi:baseplate J/gp47 family protein [Sinorhizobium sp. 6-117]|uniref:baseplate J/gp47 family protein n=1 Tax=Sinorhizobium sp. 6-117 TaxID=3049090 RepID=UPI0024C3EA14|nr:baseplate J/gp47 family protein [Sinorhizobium sp. 6-117]MDK1483122.1 baseplate J/gp47 family protein [Sinorhizobium sp. 6-117]